MDIINIFNSHNYEINCNELSPGTSITCPFDKDMTITKNEHGEVCLIKKRIIPFFKTFIKK